MALLLVIVGLDHLTERALANKRVDFVAIEKALAVTDNIVMIIIIVAVVVHLALLLIVLLAGIFAGGLLLRPSFLLGIINLLTERKKKKNVSAIELKTRQFYY